MGGQTMNTSVDRLLNKSVGEAQMMVTAQSQTETAAVANYHHRKSLSLDSSSLPATETSIDEPSASSNTLLATPPLNNCPVAGTTNATQANNSASVINKSIRKERYRCIVPYPPNSEYELELNVDDTVLVLKKRENGWYKGQHLRTGKIGLFPASFVVKDN